MRSPATRSTIDPLHSLISEKTAPCGSHPIPLIATHYDISIDAGFAVAETRRLFRNAEAQSIEATLTFPLPIQAVLFSLEAEHAGRKLKAVARKRAEAREIYEGAIEEGKAAVLHEELLRGIHMLSVAHVAPGAEVAVTARWAISLTRVGTLWQLRVPLTVGQVYGQSPLADSDALETGGVQGVADVGVRSASGRIRLSGADLTEQRARVPLNAPIDIDVMGAASRVLSGAGADGMRVSLEVVPFPEGRDSLDLAILVDRSGSMGEAAFGGPRSQTKHEALVKGLAELAPHFRKGDAVEIWEFDDVLAHVGSTRDEHPHWRIRRHHWSPGASFAQLVSRLRGPGGGTEVGAALEGVLQRTRARDLLLITDGKSYALDVQRLARMGRRIAVVLVGEDSLEANIGHLAAVTGGSMFVVSSEDIAATVAVAVETVRSCPLEVRAIDSLPQAVEVVRGGAIVKASWESGTSQATNDVIGAGVAACAAGLAIARMGEAAAAEFAERAGIVSHLTSLVLVDDVAAVQEGIPAVRKVRLPTPRADREMMFALEADASSRVCQYLSVPMMRLASPRAASIDWSSSKAWVIDWDAAPAQLLDGDLSSLDAALADALRETADDPQVLIWAVELGIKPIVLIIAALAHSERHQSRTAERIARRVFGDAPPTWVDELWLLISR